MYATRKLGRFLAPYWGWAVLAPLLMVLEVAMDLLQPRLIQQIIDQGITPGNLGVVWRTGLWMAVVALIGLVGGVGCGVYAVLAGQYFGADLRSELFRKVQAFSFGNLDKLETGALITRLTNDVTQVQEIVMMLLRVMVRAPLLMIGGLIMAIVTSPRLALLFLLLMPIVAVILAWIINKSYPLFSGVQQRLDNLNTVMQENLAGVRVVKAFVRGKHEIERFTGHRGNHAADDVAGQPGGRCRTLDWRRSGRTGWDGGWPGGGLYQLSDAVVNVAGDGEHVGDALLARRGVGGAHQRSAGE